MPYVPKLQHSWEARSVTGVINSSPILQGHMVCTTTPLSRVKVGQHILHCFQYAPS